MSCASCASSIQSYLRHREGIFKADVNYAGSNLLVEFDEAQTSESQIAKDVESLGYQILLDANEQQLDQLEEAASKELLSQLIVSAVATIPLFISAMFMSSIIPELWIRWSGLVLATPVLFYGGKRFFVNAWKRARHGTTTMDTLVALGTGVAYLYSAVITLFSEQLSQQGFPLYVYFESAAVIITLILFGRFLEDRAKRKTGAAIRSLMELQPDTALVIRNGEVVELPTAKVLEGDLLLIKAGSRIPLDGKVKKGEGSVDESMLTGESLPVEKGKKDLVFAGTVNKEGSFRMLVTQTAQSTRLAQMIQQVKQAQSDKPPIQEKADRIAAIFVPVVMVIAAVSFGLGWWLGPDPSLTFGLVNAISVLIIACPCALGLATPTALTVGIGKAAQQGILVRDARSLERISECTHMIFDKTGTLTKGKLQVQEVWQSSAMKNDEQAKAILLKMEEESEHPIAKSVVEYLKQDGKDVTVDALEIKTLRARGVQARMGNTIYRVGQWNWLEAEGVQSKADNEFADQQRAWEQKGYTVVYFSRNQELYMAIAIADSVREDAVESIKYLQSIGIQCIMLTGDQESAAQSVAEALKLDLWRARCKPEDKAAEIKQLQADGAVVGMIGDGVNDAEALATADISIAMGSGTDVAMQTAGVTIMHDKLQRIAQSIQWSKQTVRTIQQNLFWAFIYNVAAIPIAAGLLYPLNGFLLDPMIAGGAMAFSSLSVVVNSLRLNRKQITAPLSVVRTI